MQSNKYYNKEFIDYKFGDFGRLAEDEVALVFAYKKEKRLQDKNKLNSENINFYAINHKEIEDFYNCIKKIAKLKKKQKKDFKIQFAVKLYGEPDIPDGHWAFGEIYMNFSGRGIFSKKSKIKIFLADPAFPSLYFKTQLDEQGFDFEDLNKSFNVELYLPKNKIKLQQASSGCSYFAIDSVFMLSTQDKFEDLYDYIYKTAPYFNRIHKMAMQGDLPIRMKRSYQSVNYFLKLYKDEPQVFDKKVDKENRTAAESIKRHWVDKKIKDKVKRINARIQHKMDKYREILGNYVESKSDEEIDKIIKGSRITGLQEFTQNLLESKSSSKYKSKPK